MFSQPVDYIAKKAAQEKETKDLRDSLRVQLNGDLNLIQKEIDATKTQLQEENGETCIRPIHSIRGPMPEKVQKFLLKLEILEDIQREAKKHSEPSKPNSR